MTTDFIGRLVPVAALLILGIIEALGGLYFNDRRTKNDFKIEILGLVTLPTLIQPSILFMALLTMSIAFPTMENILLDVSIWWKIAAFL
ncbi:MAG: hypothetical protein JKY69_05345, partial [Flavobacteriaceae bacterium]|nr:hypothetical protein [Flavobacteriaceae bacterium]